MLLKNYAVYGAFHALLAVASGAFGAHGLRNLLSEHMLSVYETGVRYHFYHAIGLVLIALAADRFGGGRSLLTAARMLHTGIFLFSGSLYALSLSGVTKLGMITPLGGLAFIVGWGLFAVALIRSKAH
ncbi:DUF423 domain-containing protein [Paenibacillus tarimensis]